MNAVVKRDERGRLMPGSHLNDRGHPKNVIAELRERLTPYQAEFVTALVELARSPDANIRLAAIKEYFDRLAGKPAVSVDSTVQKFDHTAAYLAAVQMINRPDDAIDVTPTDPTVHEEW
jgi:hypothetical protein